MPLVVHLCSSPCHFLPVRKLAESTTLPAHRRPSQVRRRPVLPASTHSQVLPQSESWSSAVHLFKHARGSPTFIRLRPLVASKTTTRVPRCRPTSNLAPSTSSPANWRRVPVARSCPHGDRPPVSSPFARLLNWVLYHTGVLWSASPPHLAVASLGFWPTLPSCATTQAPSPVFTVGRKGRVGRTRWPGQAKRLCGLSPLQQYQFLFSFQIIQIQFWLKFKLQKL
jgi:hypothetical protein